MTSKLKKIEIIDTNNDVFFMYNSSEVHSPFDTSYLLKLKKYALEKGFRGSSKSETQFVLDALAWVSSQWKHDGMNQPPKSFNALDVLKSVHKDAKRYRCVEYGLVLSELLQSHGFVTRKIGLLSKKVAYGGFGQGHVAMEVWINDINKWVFLDPQFGSYLVVSEGKTPLNYLEAYELKSKKKWNKITVKFVVKPPIKLKEAAKKYKSFLVDYFGHITISSGKNHPRLALLLENQKPSLTFQGQITNQIVFTKKSDLIYHDMNRVSVNFKYRSKEQNFQKVAQKYKIETDKDYMANMHHFAAKPEYVLNLNNNMPLFSHYEYRSGKKGKWIKNKASSLKWDALSAENYLEVRAINKMGRSGPATFFAISYN